MRDLQYTALKVTLALQVAVVLVDASRLWLVPCPIFGVRWPQKKYRNAAVMHKRTPVDEKMAINAAIIVIAAAFVSLLHVLTSQNAVPALHEEGIALQAMSISLHPVRGSRDQLLTTVRRSRDIPQHRRAASVLNDSADAATVVTRLSCEGASSESRGCNFSQICWNAAGESYPRSRLELYSSTPRADSRACIVGDGRDPHTVCDDDFFWLYPGTVRSTFCQYRATIKAPPAASTIAAWIEEKVLVFNRHYPDNYAHAVCDDFFPIFVLLQRELGWTPTSALEWLDAGHAPLDSNLPPRTDAHLRAYSVLYADFHGMHYPTNRLFARVFPNVQQLSPERFEKQFGVKKDASGTDGAATRLCFRDAFAGAPGLSMVRTCYAVRASDG